MLFVTPPGTRGPRLTLFNEFFSYTYPSGGISTDSLDGSSASRRRRGGP